jgi:acetolactate synthase I/II/III large subunit
MKITVSEVIVRYLEQFGVEYIFGMPGAHVLPIYDCLYASKIKSILVKHEQGAAFMAGGYSKVSHRVSACIATAGPGATNLITGIANAYAERLPVLVITGETPTYIFGKGGLQESSGEGGSIDQCAMFSSITRYRKLIERTDYLGQVLNQATQALISQNPGPVLLAIPYNVQKEWVDEAVLDLFALPQRPPMAQAPSSSALDLARLLHAAKRPVLVAGYGCIEADARAEVAQLSQLLGIPVTTSLKGKGVVAEGTNLSLGCLGVTSDGQAYRYIVEHADLVIVLGAAFNERTSYLWDTKLLAGKRIVQVDKDAQQLGKVFKPDVAIHGDIRGVLTDVLEVIRTPTNEANPGQKGGLDRPTAKGSAGSDDRARPVQFRIMQQFFTRLAARFPKGALIFDDNIIFAQSYLNVSDANHYFPNSGISSLGHAIPAAIGARCFAKDSPTFAILGDGGFQMCCMEIMTAVNYGIALNVVVINNGTMSLIRKNQFQLYGERYIDCDFINPDFKLLAQSFGIHHYRIQRVDDLDALFDHVDQNNAINLIEILLDKHAFPTYLSAR